MFMKKIAVIIMIIGLGLTIFTAITFFTKEKVVEIGKIEITRDKPHHLDWYPLIGIVVMWPGGVIYWLVPKK